MKDTEKLLTETIKKGLKELPKQGINTFVSEEEDGIHCMIGNDEYLIIVGEPAKASEYVKMIIKATKITENESLESRITELIRKVGIPANLKGYYYIRHAIRMVIEHPDVINAITKKLYPDIAELCETTPARVERAIRHAIELAWDRGNIEYLNELFKYSVSHRKSKPTNSEFIALLADTLCPDIFAKRVG